MTLTNIEYGSLASSNVINNNFSYLDNKISESAEVLNTRISSLLSNVATLNSALSELSEYVRGAVDDLNTKTDLYKNNIKLLISKNLMVPDWSGLYSIQFALNTEYQISQNGYVLFIPAASTKGTITVNNKAFYAKISGSAYDFSSQLSIIPVKKDDILKSSLSIQYAYFLPVAQLGTSDI